MTETGGGATPELSTGEPSPYRRHRRRIVAVASLVVALGVVVAATVMWNRVTVHPVSMDAARERAGTDSAPSTPAAPLVPAAGVYQYRGTGTERLDRPRGPSRKAPTSPAR